MLGLLFQEYARKPKRCTKSFCAQGMGSEISRHHFQSWPPSAREHWNSYGIVDSLGLACRVAGFFRQSWHIVALRSLVLALVTERDTQNDILRELSRGPTRLLRVNAGLAYQGRIIEQTPARLILSPWYPIKLAAEGVSDLIGWTTINESSVARIAVFTAIEVKGVRTRITAEQNNFIELVRRAGGRAGIARSVDEARAIIEG